MKEARGGDFGACAILLRPEPDGAPAVPNYRDAGEDYYRPTRICPIMHVVGIRESLLRTPSVASGDTFLFLEAKRLCYRDMEKIGFVFTTLPWPVDERARALMMGEDFWSYGMQQNTRRDRGDNALRPRTGTDRGPADGRGPVRRIHVRSGENMMTNMILTLLSTRSDRAAHRSRPLARPHDLHGGGGTCAARPHACRARPAPPPHLSRAGRGRRPPCRRAAGGRRPPGQRVAVWLPSRIETAVALLACSRNGYVCCPSCIATTRSARSSALLERMRAARAHREPGYGADADRHDIFALAAELPFLKLTYASRAAARRSTSWLQPCQRRAAQPRSEQGRLSAFTSGTTGAPKGVMHSDNTLLANARALAADWGFGARLRDLLVQPAQPQSRLRRDGRCASPPVANWSCMTCRAAPAWWTG